jgi:transcriptional regulator with XRE-family HTH domain
MPEEIERPAIAEDMQLGARVRAGRRQKGWTLDELARRSNLSKSYLSRIEDGDRHPSIAALLSIARACSISLASLVGDDQPVLPGVVVRGIEAPVSQGNGLTYQVLTSGGRPTAMQPVRISVPADRAGDELYRHEGEEWLYVLSGTLILTLGSEEYRLDPGDSAHFDAGIPHRLNALNGRDVEAILVASAAPRSLLGSYL